MVKSNSKRLGQLAFNRLSILSALKAKRHTESLKEQLREIEKQMVMLGWDGQAHSVVMTGDGPRVKQEKVEGIIIRAKPFSVSAHINKYF